MKKLVALASLVAVSLTALGALAAPIDATSRAGFERATEALAADEPDRAVVELEKLADRGIVHPDVSYDRGLAYLRKAGSGVRKPGDLGQAIAGFQECLELDPGDAEATRALEAAELLLAKDRSRKRNDVLVDTAPLSLRALRFLEPNWLLVARILGAALLALGLVFGFTRRTSLRLAGTVLSIVGGFVLITASLLATLRSSATRGAPAVVVVERAPLVEPSGRTETKKRALVEGQKVQLISDDGRWARIRTDGDDAWVARSSLRLVAPRS